MLPCITTGGFQVGLGIAGQQRRELGSHCHHCIRHAEHLHERAEHREYRVQLRPSLANQGQRAVADKTILRYVAMVDRRLKLQLGWQPGPIRNKLHADPMVETRVGRPPGPSKCGLPREWPGGSQYQVAVRVAERPRQQLMGPRKARGPRRRRRRAVARGAHHSKELVATAHLCEEPRSPRPQPAEHAAATNRPSGIQGVQFL
mmetsp:Transcript_64035/g.183938  ORF Transcript_64035/g.183938 Transcript_64035/m.183938 type:complete len:203 (-) Transcript_64035:392-1000(-)